MTLRHPGFSTGALELGDYRRAVSWLIDHGVETVELSAMREHELAPLAESLDDLPLGFFQYISFHAPTSFPPEHELKVLDLLEPVRRRGWNVVVHPDMLYTPARWLHFGSQLLIENMDRRKATGRTVEELRPYFEDLPEARLCLDLAHARQLDTSLILLRQIIAAFAARIAEVHVSELDSRCKHRPLSEGAVEDYRALAAHWSASIPVIVESALDGRLEGLRLEELELARLALGGRERDRAAYFPTP